MEIVINDTNILIDLFNAGLLGYCRQLDIEFRTLDVIMEELLLYINQNDNPSECVGEIIAKLYENKSKSEVFKKEEKLDFEGLTRLSEKKTTNVELKNRVVLFDESETSSVYLQEDLSNILMAIYRRKNNPKNTVPLQLGKGLA